MIMAVRGYQDCGEKTMTDERREAMRMMIAADESAVRFFHSVLPWSMKIVLSHRFVSVWHLFTVTSEPSIRPRMRDSSRWAGPGACRGHRFQDVISLVQAMGVILESCRMGG